MFGRGKLLSQIVHLTEFLKTNLTKLAVKEGQKIGFLRPISSKITLAKEKERKNRKNQGKRKEVKRKRNGSILSFHIGYFIHTLTHVSLQCPQRPGISAHWTHKINTKQTF